MQRLPNVDFTRPCRDCKRIVGFNDTFRSPISGARIPFDIRTGHPHKCGGGVITLRDASGENEAIAYRETEQ